MFEGFAIVGLASVLSWSSGSVLCDWLDPVSDAELRYASKASVADSRKPADDKAEIAKVARRQSNGAKGAVLYSDSWGEGHELKRMDASDALSITCGMYYLTDSVPQ